MNEQTELNVKLTVKEIDFVLGVLGALPTSQSVLSGMSHLLLKIRGQAQAEIKDLSPSELAQVA